METEQPGYPSDGKTFILKIKGIMYQIKKNISLKN